MNNGARSQDRRYIFRSIQRLAGGIKGVIRTSGQLEKARSGAWGAFRKVAVTLTNLSLTQVNNFFMGDKGWRIRANKIDDRKRKGRVWEVKIRLEA
jgi:hypothetical protein